MQPPPPPPAAAEEPPPPPPAAEHASRQYVCFEVAWMVATDANSAGDIQWVQFPWHVEKQLEDMYMDASKGVDDYVV